MKIDVIADAADITDEKVDGKIAVVIDVLRATSVMVTALENGTDYIIPVTSVDECNQLTKKLKECVSAGKKVLRGGERNTYRIDDFELDNSPLSYSRDAVRNSVVVMTTTNGTRTINCCHKASEILIGCLLNAYSIVEYLIEKKQDVVLVCSGRKNRYTMEDGYCAGYITSLLNKRVECQLSDFAWEQKHFYECFSNNPLDALIHCEHYNNIKDRLSGDVTFCLQKNIFERIPKIHYNENCGYQEIR